MERCDLTRTTELTLFCLPPTVSLNSCRTADIDGDGRVELITGGSRYRWVDGPSGLFWYRPSTFEWGIVDDEEYGVGLALEDIDGDGLPEVIADAVRAGRNQVVVWKPGPNLRDEWTCTVIDPDSGGMYHDLHFADVDGDGRRELIAGGVGNHKGLHIYRPSADRDVPWTKTTIECDVFAEGVSTADLDGCGRLEIVHGPYWYKLEGDDPYRDPWIRRTYAPPFREMCRTAICDVNGDGRPDIVVTDSEYLDGRLSWYENRLTSSVADAARGGRETMVEHVIDTGLYYSHSLHPIRDETSGDVRIMVGEMTTGGWVSAYRYESGVYEYRSGDGGVTWRQDVVSRNQGTHEAVLSDIDGDGELEVVGKTWGMHRKLPAVQVWKRVSTPSPITEYRHELVDRDRNGRAIEVLALDVDGDGVDDILAGPFRYRAPGWARTRIPGIAQVLTTGDVDGDGRPEVIAIAGQNGLSSDLVWLKPSNESTIWPIYPIGAGSGDWPHGTLVAPIRPEGRAVLFCAYHNASAENDIRLEWFEPGADPAEPWIRHRIDELPYRENMVLADIDGDGTPDIVCGTLWLRNVGDGRFEPRAITREQFDTCRVAVMDVNGDGHPDIVVTEHNMGWNEPLTEFSRIAWFENPGARGGEWAMRVIDKARCPHSLAVADLDGDGLPELLVGEHDTRTPYRTRCRLMAYKPVDRFGQAWKRWTIDERFEHHDGCRLVRLADGTKGIASIGFTEERYVHLWRPA